MDMEKSIKLFCSCHMMHKHKNIDGYCPSCGAYIKDGRVYFEFDILMYPKIFELFHENFTICQEDKKRICKEGRINGFKIN